MKLRFVCLRNAACFANVLLNQYQSGHFCIVLNLLLCSLYYAEACNRLVGPISASLRPGNIASFEEMSQRWRAVGNSVSNLTCPRFEPQTSLCRDKRVIVRPIDQCSRLLKNLFLPRISTDRVAFALAKWGL